MSTITKNQNRKPLEDFFFYEVRIENGVVELHAYPIFDQDCSSRANIDTSHSVRDTIKTPDDVEDETIVDVAYMEDGIVIDFGFSGTSLWEEAEDALEDLGIKLKEQGKI